MASDRDLRHYPQILLLPSLGILHLILAKRPRSDKPGHSEYCEETTGPASHAKVGSIATTRAEDLYRTPSPNLFRLCLKQFKGLSLSSHPSSWAPPQVERADKASPLGPGARVRVAGPSVGWPRLVLTHVVRVGLVVNGAEYHSSLVTCQKQGTQSCRWANALPVDSERTH